MVYLEANRKFYGLLAAVLATVLVPVLAVVAERLRIIGSDGLAEIALAVPLYWLFPESWSGKSWRVVCWMVLVGLALAALWIASVGAWEAIATRPGIWSTPKQYLIVGFLSTTVAAPLFEEKVVRNLLLDGLGQWIGCKWASLIVSALFALAHASAPMFAFCFSLFLCWLAIRWRVNSYQRGIAHGTLNLAIMLYVMYGGFG